MSQPYTLKNYTPEESIGFLLKRAGMCLTAAIDRELAPLEMTHAQLGIFFRLRGATKSGAELAREHNIDTGAMTRMLDRLEDKGFIVRVQHPDDRRITNLSLTEKGEQMAEQILIAAMNVLNRHLRGFEPDEIERFKDYLRRMVAND